MYKRIGMVLVLAALIAACGSTSLASATPGVASTALVSRVQAHGLRVTLTVPRRQYPRNALIQVTLTVKNISRHSISIMSGLQAPLPFVIDPSGGEGYSPLNPLGDEALFYLTGPGPRSQVLPRGGAWRSDPYLVLRGNRISYTVVLGKIGGGGATIHGRPVTVGLTEEPSPQVTVSTSPALQATVISSEPVSGQLQYVSQTACGESGAASMTGEGWTAVSGTVVRPQLPEGTSGEPGCTGQRTWRGLVGWLNHPVVAISYQDPP